MASKPPFPPFKLGVPAGFMAKPGIGPKLGPIVPAGLHPMGPQLKAAPVFAGITPQRASEIETIFRTVGATKDKVDEFLKLLSETQIEWLKRLKDGAGVANDLKFIIQFYVYLRKTGMPVSDITRFFGFVLSRSNVAQLDTIRKLVSNTSRLDRFFSVVGAVAKPIEILIFYMAVNDHAARGAWDQVIVEVYKFGIGKAAPWAAFIDALQSLLESVLPKNAKSTYTFKIIRSIDLVGLSSAGVDSIIFFALSIYNWNKPFDEDRLNKLATRLKTGPTAIFYEFGKKIPIGEILYDVMNLNSNKGH